MRKLASPFGHPTQVSTQVQLAATWNYLRVRLTRAFKRALKTIAEHVRFNSWYISFPSSAKQQREMAKF